MNRAPLGSLTWRDNHGTCPGCGSSGWCGVAELPETGEIVYSCKRDPEPTDENSAFSYGVWLGPGDKLPGTLLQYRTGRVSSMPADWTPPPPKPAPVAPPVADPDTLHLVYSWLIEASNASQSSDARREIESRGLEPSVYGVVPRSREDRERLGRAAAKAHGAEVLGKVPGFWQDLETGRWRLGGLHGILIPCRDLDGRIRALKVRAFGDDVERYTSLASVRHGGPGPGAHAHVPLPRPGGGRVRLTEGELKADEATIRSGVLTISAPGVGSWRKALDLISESHESGTVVALAFDADTLGNKSVCGALGRAAKGIREAGFALEVETWAWDPAHPKRHKGIDDALRAGLPVRGLRGDEAWDWITARCLAAGIEAPVPPEAPAMPVESATVSRPWALGPDDEPDARMRAELAEISPNGAAHRLVRVHGAWIRRYEDGKIPTRVVCNRETNLWREIQSPRTAAIDLCDLVKPIEEGYLDDIRQAKAHRAEVVAASGVPLDRDARYRHLEEQEKRQAKMVSSLGSAPGRVAVEEFVGCSRSQLAQPSDFDSRVGEIPTASGIVDLSTLEVRPITPGDMAMSRTVEPYDPGAECPMFRMILERVQPDVGMRRFLHMVLGYSIVGDGAQQTFYAHQGTGGNGKSLVLNAVAHALRGVGRDFSGSVPADAFLKSRTERHMRLTYLTGMRGKRFVTCSEPSSGEVLDTGLIKNVTGEAMIEMRYSQGNPFVVRRTAVLHFITNDALRVDDASDGMMRRLVAIPWAYQQKPGDRIENIEQILASESRGILAWLIDGAHEYLQSPGSVKLENAPECVRDLSQSEMEESDPTRAWVRERVIAAPGQRLYKAEAFNDYSSWIRDHAPGRRPGSQHSFSARLKAKGWSEGKFQGSRFWADKMLRAE